MQFKKQNAIIAKQFESCLMIVGVDDAGGPPVPIPNTEVKPSGAENTWLETAWENREMPTPESFHPVGWLFFCLKKVGIFKNPLKGIFKKPFHRLFIVNKAVPNETDGGKRLKRNVA